MKHVRGMNREALSGTLTYGGSVLLGAAIWMGGVSGWAALLLAVGAVACWLGEDRLWLGRAVSEEEPAQGFDSSG